MARRRLDYGLYHRRIYIDLDPQYSPCLRAHLYAHRYPDFLPLPVFLFVSTGSGKLLFPRTS
ncbi:MAG TPA: hypothetical protein H9807_09255 [Candidatus Bacteroides merdavium]|uniref:Uncharacterized protein n=1 Tax=Candidatus Bacteroides merdavium TaxID=2838472 RepID=A0A9D2GYB2_9BACE|nr:hypothetical protein [Candidatus Bacteroides merdavium]